MIPPTLPPFLPSLLLAQPVFVWLGTRGAIHLILGAEFSPMF